MPFHSPQISFYFFLLPGHLFYVFKRSLISTHWKPAFWKGSPWDIYTEYFLGESKDFIA
jgi:hypothetical protein